MLFSEIDINECPIEGIKKYSALWGGLRVVLAIDGDVEGYLLFDDSRIYHVYVDEGHRTFGIGTRLIDATLNIVGHPLRTVLSSKYPLAVKLFVKAGFVPVGRQGDYVVYDYVGDVRADKDVKPSPYSEVDVFSQDFMSYLNDYISS